MAQGDGSTEAMQSLMRANLLEVFGERDPQRRRLAIERTYAEDVVFLDPDGTVEGWEALDAKVQELLDRAPGFSFTPADQVYVNHDLGYLAWNFGPEGRPPAVRGFDVCFFRDGRIAKMYTVLLTD